MLPGRSRISAHADRRVRPEYADQLCTAADARETILGFICLNRSSVNSPPPCVAKDDAACAKSLAWPQAESFDHPDKGRQRLRPHLSHDVAPVNLDGDLSDSKLVRDLLVHEPIRDTQHDLPFAF